MRFCVEGEESQRSEKRKPIVHFFMGKPGGGGCCYLMVSYSSCSIYMMTPSSLEIFFLRWGGGAAPSPFVAQNI